MRTFLYLLVAQCFTVPVMANDFEAWKSELAQEAVAQGINEVTVQNALQDVTFDARVVRLDQRQPEKKITLEEYLTRTISDARIARGRDIMREHADILSTIGQRYGVQPEYIVALWAIESDYGRNQGGFPVIQSLATLAYDSRRGAFFRKELLAALRIMDREAIAPDAMIGSWAGAMGNCQFMPSTYLAYAVDGDGDQKRDIWDSVPDTFASIASYLHALNWNPNQSWQEPLSDGSTRPTDNFNALLKWNRSRYFATAVGQLADAIGETR